MDDTDAGQAPMLRIVRGQPDDIEIAALAAATARLSIGAEGGTEPEGLSAWADRAAMLRYPGGRRPLRPGPGAWRASALPR